MRCEAFASTRRDELCISAASSFGVAARVLLLLVLLSVEGENSSTNVVERERWVDASQGFGGWDRNDMGDFTPGTK